MTTEPMKLDEAGLEAAMAAFMGAINRGKVDWGAEVRAAITAYLTATRPDTGDLVSRAREAIHCTRNEEGKIVSASVVSVMDAAQIVSDLCDFISRLSTAPAGDVVLVPREPTEAMLLAGFDYGVNEWPDDECREALPEIYRAMIAAAPSPSPQTSPATEGEVDAEQHLINRLGLVCTSCGSTKSLKVIRSDGHSVSCCPERDMRPPPAKAGEGDRTPDYCFMAQEWEATYTWDNRHTMMDDVPLGEVERIETLFKGPTKWMAHVPITWHEGEPDDWELKVFDSEDEARAALSPPRTP